MRCRPRHRDVSPRFVSTPLTGLHFPSQTGELTGTGVSKRMGALRLESTATLCNHPRMHGLARGGTFSGSSRCGRHRRRPPARGAHWPLMFCAPDPRAPQAMTSMGRSGHGRVRTSSPSSRRRTQRCSHERQIVPVPRGKGSYLAGRSLGQFRSGGLRFKSRPALSLPPRHRARQSHWSGARSASVKIHAGR
jgi:hypothetical protein